MFDARAEHAKLIENVDELLAKTASRVRRSQAANVKPSSKTAALAEQVHNIQVEAAAKHSELTKIIEKKAARRAEKVAEARHIASVAMNLLVA